MAKGVLRPRPPRPAAPPPIWQLELDVLEMSAEQLGVARQELFPHLRLIQDLHVDSLDLVEYMMEVEDRFEINVSDADAQRLFITQQVTLHDIATLVFHLWGNGRRTPPRLFAWHRTERVCNAAASSQLGGAPSASDIAAGELYVPLGRPDGVSLYQRKTDGMRCAQIPAAAALIGSADAGVMPDQRPAHRVTLSAFLIDMEPVTTTAYARFLNAIGPIPESVRLHWCDVTDRRKPCFQLENVEGRWRPLARTGQHPMVLVSWFGANAYSLWANRRDWRMYQGMPIVPDELRGRAAGVAPAGETLWSFLPSEGQWEYAARGPEGATGGGRAMPWAARHVPGDTYTAATMPLLPVTAAEGRSPFGPHHMPGNVWNWCRDFYAADFYDAPSGSAAGAQNAEPTAVRSERGGSWVGPQRLATVGYRRGRVPAARGRCLGFRCVGLSGDL